MPSRRACVRPALCETILCHHHSSSSSRPSPFLFAWAQGHIKRDAAGYQDEFELQWRHYNACLELLRLSPDQPSAELGELVSFVAHVAGCYPQQTASFAPELTAVLEEHHAAMDPALRLTLVKALILLRNKNGLAAAELVPALFRMFRLRDKALRQLVFRHVTSDIRAANKAGRDEKLNRAMQRFMYGAVADAHEGTAKSALAVLTEMWRRRVWRDARTVNVIATAVQHRSPRILLAALKFFAGQDAASGDGDDSDDEEAGGDEQTNGASRVAPPTREDIDSAVHKGTRATKKKKQKKLARVKAAVQRAERRREGAHTESFAALQLLHDPQSFAEALLARLRAGPGRWEMRLLMMNVLSRVIGVHKLVVLNFYPLVQKYIRPKTEQVTVVLSAFVQACHDEVPPDALAPTLRTLVDQFVNDGVRHEVMAVGLKTVRELCMRTPLVMTPELLQDLVAYKKTRNKVVSSAARALVSLFRELAPGLLEKKDRGRGADLAAAPRQYGASTVAAGVEGMDLLLQAEREGKFDSDGDLIDTEDEEEGDEESGDEEVIEGSDGEDEGAVSGDDSEAIEGSGDEDEGVAASGDDSEADSDDEEGDLEDELEEGSSDELDGSLDGDAALTDDEDASEGDSDDSDASGSDEDELGVDREVDIRVLAPKKPQPAPQAGSLTQMRKQLSEARAAQEEAEEDDAFVDRILGPEDFERIRQLQRKRLIQTAMEVRGAF